MSIISKANESSGDRDICDAINLVDLYDSPGCLDEDLPDFIEEEPSTKRKRNSGQWWRSEVSGASRLDQDVLLSPDPQDAEIEDIVPDGSEQARKKSRLSSPSSNVFQSVTWDDDEDELGVSQPVSSDDDSEVPQRKTPSMDDVTWSGISSIKANNCWDTADKKSGSSESSVFSSTGLILQTPPETPRQHSTQVQQQNINNTAARRGFFLQSDKEVQDNGRKSRIATTATTLPEPHPEPKRHPEDEFPPPIEKASPSQKLSVSPMAKIVSLIPDTEKSGTPDPRPMGSPGRRPHPSPGHKSPKPYLGEHLQYISERHVTQISPIVYSPASPRTLISVPKNSPRFAASASPQAADSSKENSRVPHFGLSRSDNNSPDWQSTGSPPRLKAAPPPPKKQGNKAKNTQGNKAKNTLRRGAAAAVKSGKQTPTASAKVVLDGRDGARFSFGAEDKNSGDWDSGGEAFNDDPALLFSRPVVPSEGSGKSIRSSHESTPVTPKPIPAINNFAPKKAISSKSTKSNAIIVDSPTPLLESPPLSSTKSVENILPTEPFVNSLSASPPPPSVATENDAIVVHKSTETFEARRKAAREAARKRAAPRRRQIVAHYGPESAPLTYFPVNQVPSAFMMHSESQRKSIALLGAELGKYPRRTRQKPLRWWMNEAYVFERPKGSQCAIVVGVRRRPIADDHVVLHPTGNNSGQYLKIIDVSQDSPLLALPSPGSSSSSARPEETQPLQVRLSDSPLATAPQHSGLLSLPDSAVVSANDAPPPVQQSKPKKSNKSKAKAGKIKSRKKNNAAQDNSNLKVIRRADIGFVPVSAGSDTFNVAIVLETPQVTLCEIVFGPRRDKGRDTATSDITGEVVWGEAACCLLAVGDATSKISFTDESSKAVDQLAAKAKKPSDKTTILQHTGKQAAAYKLSRGSWFLIPKGTSYNLFNLSETSQLVLALNVEIVS